MLFSVEIMRLCTLPVVGKWTINWLDADLAPDVCFGCTDETKGIDEWEMKATVMKLGLPLYQRT